MGRESRGEGGGHVVNEGKDASETAALALSRTLLLAGFHVDVFAHPQYELVRVDREGFCSCYHSFGIGLLYSSRTPNHGSRRQGTGDRNRMVPEGRVFLL